MPSGPGQTVSGMLGQNSRSAPTIRNGEVIYTSRGSAQQSGALIDKGQETSAASTSSSSDPELRARNVTMSFVDTDVREFARVLFSELLKRPYAVDPGITGTITLRSGGDVDGNTALTLAKQALAASGNTIIVSDGVYRVTSLNNVAPGASANLQTYDLKFIDGASAQNALAALVQGRAEIVAVTSSSLSMRGDAETLVLVSSMLQIIDVDRFRTSSFALFPLKVANAAEMAVELRTLYSSSGVEGTTILPIERMNAVLVIAARAAQIDFAQKWVQRLDKGHRDERQVFVYQIKNRQADDLAGLLRDIFSQSTASSDNTSAAAVLPVSETNMATPAAGRVSSQGTDSVKITADGGSNTLVIWASSEEYELMEKALRRLDTPLRQVYVEATIAEVRLNQNLEHGVRWFLESGVLSGGVSDASNGAIAPQFPGFNFSIKVPQASVVISALESYTDVKVVSSPQIMVIDRQTATIQVGDQVPIVTKSVQDTSSGVNVIANDVTFRDTGVILKVTPQIRSSGEVMLDINQEVSRVVPTTSSQINSPTISQRKVTSTVLVPDGTAIVLGGLISSSDEVGGGGLPGTQKTVFESIFGSKQTKASRSELIIIIRPVIIHDSTDMKEVINEIAAKMGDVMNVQVN